MCLSLLTQEGCAFSPSHLACSQQKYKQRKGLLQNYSLQIFMTSTRKKKHVCQFSGLFHNSKVLFLTLV